jgi:hypothetical protein
VILKWGGGFVVFVLAMGACHQGLQDVREAATNRAPTAISCADLVANPPDNAWVRVTGAKGALRDAAFRSTNGKTDRVYVPLTCDGPPQRTIRLVLSSEDSTLLGAIVAQKDVELARVVTGMLRSAREHSTGTTTGGGLDGGCAQCSVKIDNLDPDYVVLEEGATPSALRGVAWLVGALVGYGALARILTSAPPATSLPRPR